MDGTVDGDIKIFFDKDGNWTKYVEFYRSVHHDSTFCIAEDPDISIPGHGVVIHDAGRIMFYVVTWEILFQAGPGDFYADTSPFCEFFGSLR